jgi:hypothetical protein
MDECFEKKTAYTPKIGQLFHFAKLFNSGPHPRSLSNCIVTVLNYITPTVETVEPMGFATLLR